MTGTRKRLVRTAIAALFALPFFALSTAPSSAGTTTQADVAAAQAKLNDLNHQLEVVVEQYNAARIHLDQMKTKLAGAKAEMDQAQAEADAARTELGLRAAEAYTGMGSQLDTLLGAQDFTQFSDRLEFMGALAQNDADLATKADTARQRSEWAAQQYNGAVADAQTQLDAVNGKRGEISGLLDQAQVLYQQTNQNYQSALAAQRAAAAAQASVDNSGATGGTSGGGDTGGGGTSGGGTYNPPPPNVTGAARAIDAARQAIGSSYVFGTAGPSTFDCSGLTSWAWAQAGVYLPHSSAAQYESLPHVDPSQMQPGDLLFFYSPISHVALYIGGGMMIHARHPGPGGEVQEGSVAGYGTPVVGVARP
jgi:peptidoglycan DL-endopeptidase CwlO